MYHYYLTKYHLIHLNGILHFFILDMHKNMETHKNLSMGSQTSLCCQIPEANSQTLTPPPVIECKRKYICKYIHIYIFKNPLLLPMLISCQELQQGCQVSVFIDVLCKTSKLQRHQPLAQKKILVNSLWPSDTIWHHRILTILALVMVCCLTATGPMLTYHQRCSVAFTWE